MTAVELQKVAVAVTDAAAVVFDAVAVVDDGDSADETVLLPHRRA